MRGTGTSLKFKMESAIDKLEALLQKTDSDLNYVALRLDYDFSHQFGNNGESQLNPLKLLERIKNSREELKTMEADVLEIRKEQKEVQEQLYSNLLPSQQILQMLQQQTGLQVSEKTDEEEFLRCAAPDSQEDVTRSSLGCKSTNKEECSKENSNTNNVQYPDNTNGSTEIKRTLKEFLPVTESEFNGVSELVRGRAKLEAVNKVHQVLFDHFKKHKKSSPLTPQDMTKMGLKITGATGLAKLKVLRALKIINLTNKGAAQWLI